jgi:ferric iron reductase protein FhuF
MNEAQLKDFSTKFDLHPAPPEGALHSFRAVELVQEQGMRAFVDSYRPLMKALDDKAVAAYFGSWMASTALALQYTVTCYSFVLDLSLANLNIHLIPDGGYCRVAFSLNDWKTGDLSAAEDQSREVWREQVLTRYYQETAGPLFRSISQVSGLALGEIWGQLPTKFNYYVEQLAAGLPDKDINKRLEDDYDFLKDQMPPEVFQMPRNPFHVKVRRIESLQNPEETMQMRNRCCMYYRTEGGRLCYNCPRMKEDARAERRAEFRSEMASAQG